MKKILPFLLVILLFVSCKNEPKEKESPNTKIAEKSYEKLEQLQWLRGNWTNITAEEQSYENWALTNDSTLNAHSFTLVEKDTVFAERVTLRQDGDDLYFTVVAYNQNDDRPITFKLISSDNGIYVFENPNHDFPTRISYTNPVKDSIYAWIEGTVEGKSRKVDFYFKRE